MEHKEKSDEDKGQLLYYQCRQSSSNVKLEHKDVDDFFLMVHFKCYLIIKISVGIQIMK